MRGRIRFQRELQNTYIITEENRKEILDGYWGQMVLRGKIRGLAHCEVHIIDGQREIWYDISFLQSLEQVFAVKEMAFEDIKSLLVQIIGILEQMEKYLLNAGQLCFEPSYLFWDMDQGALSLLYDFTEEVPESSLIKLAEFILERTCHEDEKAVDLAYFFYECSSKESFSMKKVEQYLEGQTEGSTERKPSQSQEEETWENRTSIKTEDLYEKEFQKEIFQEEQQLSKKTGTINKTNSGGLFLNQGCKGKMAETGLVCDVMAVLSGIGFFVLEKYFILDRLEIVVWIVFSVVLALVGIILFLYGCRDWKWERKSDQEKGGRGEEKKKTGHTEEQPLDGTGFSEGDMEEMLCCVDEKNREMDGKTIYIGKSLLNREYTLTEIKKGSQKEYTVTSYPYLIGKDKERVNLYVKEHSVSRIHARLLEEGGEIYLEDLHSTNGTFLNDLPLEPHDKVKIRRGDIILFGNAEFAFR